jgi:hypothetical protein
MNDHFLKKYGEWAVVTGASDGIGKSIALELAKRGFKLVIVARRESHLGQLESEIRGKSKVEVKVLAVDLSEQGASQKLISETQNLNVGLFAGIAGFGTSGDLISTDVKNELNMIDLNCKFLVEQTRYFAERFAAQKRGGIILMGSLVGFQGAPRSANYAATKAFVQTFGEGIHYELKPFGVDVLVSAPGPVASGFSERARMKMGMADQPSQVARGTLNALGKCVTVRPGVVSKFLGWSLMLLPRGIRVRVMQMIMKGMTEH